MLYVNIFPTVIYLYVFFIIIQKRESIKVPDKAPEMMNKSR